MKARQKANSAKPDKDIKALIRHKKSQISERDTSRQYILPKKQWSKICAMAGEDRREFLSSIFHSDQYSSGQIVDLMAKEYCLQKINFSDFEIDPKIAHKIPRRICEKYGLIPVMEVEGTIIIAFSDPGDMQARDDVSLLLSSKIEMMVAERSEIEKMITFYHKGESSADIKNLFSVVETDIEEPANEGEEALHNKNIQDSPAVQSVAHIIQEGVRMECSDIHIEVYEKLCRVRYRVDGHLSEYIHPPRQLATSIASRIKVIAKLDISEKRLPQDGRLKIKIEGKIVNFRVSTVPVVNGEKVVMRILDSSSLGKEMSELGMEESQLKAFKKYLSVSQGLILMTGPTGSGKTTTIYSGLQFLNKPHRNISTVEDPVEYKINGINQVQVNAKIGLTFSNVLRSFLRQDPDVILVGEIRDTETANIAYRAAATGHLVLSTLHTNDSTSTITRLVDIGLPAYSVADNTSIVIAQRLLRVLCEKCKVPQNPSLKVLVDLGFDKETAGSVRSQVMKPEGCQYCNSTGYKGRVAVFEVLEIFPELKTGIFKGLPPKKLKALAIESNRLQTLRQSALEKLSAGQTSIHEVAYGTIGDRV